MSTRRREFAATLLLITFSLALALGVGEVLFRVALFSDVLPVPQLRQPWRFADSTLDDDYWKLTWMFRSAERAQRVGWIHPLYGWAPETTEDNPLGIVSARPYRREDIRNPVLFFGDSFVYGATPDEQRIPQQMDRLLPDHSVLNYGVGGYGVDQIYLRYSRSVGEFEKPVVLFGILTRDLHRSVLAFRTAQKPYYDHEDGELLLRNVPILPVTADYIRDNPPEISSYVLRFLLMRARNLIPEDLFDTLLGYDRQKERKLEINRRILEALQRDSAASMPPVTVVLFYGDDEIRTEPWTETYLKKNLDELGIAYFDTKAVLLDWSRRHDRPVEDLYYADNGHPNELGNRVISEGLIRWLEGRGLLGKDSGA